jgi:hypothetical protein
MRPPGFAKGGGKVQLLATYAEPLKGGQFALFAKRSALSKVEGWFKAPNSNNQQPAAILDL